ncbi:shikimate dehydrogenase [Solilutibacter silvestris]|uniref:Shikimate dehydrogenase (NADP(+)) n=1 Tax=Solilutibacter silvestris TaxID=1645665 RepID=A0A2K1Q0M4_9GAMM|nr:shikimate dehydrogenase [Lysobacter silvestris]PNS08590.1 aroE: shikimate 5-dehydrogenase [Lysobacter silvestris]
MSLPHYAVLGAPVAHSLSPRIHAEFARQCGIDMLYVAIDTAAGFDVTLERFQRAGGIGANVTAPDKLAAAAAAQSLSPRARRAGAVNTLIWRDNHWFGDITDGSGLVRDLRERRDFAPFSKRVLLIGAGGAARAVAPALLDADIAQLVVANRTRANAWDLVDQLHDSERAIACTLEELPGLGSFDLVLSAVPPDEGDGVPDYPASILGDESTAIDLNYGARALPFLAWAKGHGCTRTSDGLGMLVEQAADSFELWHGVRPQTDAIYTQLRMGG